MTTRRLTAAFCAASVPFLQACGAGWHRTDIVTPESPRQQVEVWQGKSSQQWHGVHVTDSTVSGISYVSPINCDSCRVTVARSAVDSIRLGNPVAGFWKTIVVFVAIPGLIVAYLAQGFMEGT
ncbi:MAG TPA: hypothetical protein VI159_11460 [Gemmatimonadales bacterium]